MKHFLLKFNHGVEIGARNAYLGHFHRTKNDNIFAIAGDELEHEKMLTFILKINNEIPSKIIDNFFFTIGAIIFYTCRIAPLWSLDFIARTMELFAIINYKKLAKIYPEYRVTFERMAETEDMHKQYFSIKR